MRPAKTASIICAAVGLAACVAAEPGDIDDDLATETQALGPASAHAFATVTANGGVVANSSFNSTGGGGTVTTPGPPGLYTVTFGGVGGHGGNVQVVATGTTNHRCQVVDWVETGLGDLAISVQCQRPDGAPEASGFVVQYARKTAAADGVGAYVSAYDPANPAYCATGDYTWNSTGGANCLRRLGVGDYRVDLDGLAAAAGTVQVTSHGATGVHCKLRSQWGPLGTQEQIRVRCFDPVGAAVDSVFSVSFSGDQEVSAYDYGGYAKAHHPTSAGYSPDARFAYNSGNADGDESCSGWLGDIDAGHFAASVGRYFLRYENLSHITATPHVTALGTDAAYCKVEDWIAWPAAGGVEVRTQCYAASGAKVDSVYVNHYVTGLVRGPC